MIATSHGVIWRDNPVQIVEKYAQWANDYKENQITIIYDTMWNGTKALAENIAKGISEEDNDVMVKVFNLAKTDDNDVITEVFKSKTIVVGSPTIMGGILHSMAGFMHLIKDLKFKKKKGCAFGCYGWKGESVRLLNGMLEDAGFEVINEGFEQNWHPDNESLEKAVEFGREIARK